MKRSNVLPPIMKYKNQMSENLKDTSNLFASYFSSVYRNSSNNTPTQCQDNCNNYFPLSLADIQAVIILLDRNKMNSPDDLPIIFYKNTMHNISIPLFLLFKLSISSMKYPDIWKISHLTPIYKAGDSTNVENYRPISILSAAAKFFDKIIYKHIHSKVSNLISSRQLGQSPPQIC